MSNTARRLVLWSLGGLLALIGVVLGAGGAWLASLGGSLYYLPTGLACLVSGVLIARGKRAGMWLYLVVVALTVVWALFEVGPHFWLLLPRLAGPLVLALYMMMPWVRKALALGPLVRQGAGRKAALAAGAVAVLAGGGMLLRDGTGLAQSPAGGSADGATRWADYGGNKGGTRFSPAAQITPANAADLDVAWTYRTGDLPQGAAPQMFQATPLQIDDTLYLCSPHNIIIALDADTGKERWRYDPKVDATGVYTVACRGVSYHETAAPAVVGAAADAVSGGAAAKACARRIIVSTIDGRMIAVNAANGKPCADFGEGGQISLRTGLGAVKGGVQFTTSPAAIIGNTAVVGSFVLDNMGTDNPSGVVRAFDVISGRQLWAWDAGRHDPAAPLKAGENYTKGSPNAWSLFSADEGLGLVYIPTGNPSPDHFGGQRNADMERYGSSVVALDAASGQVRWAFQTVHHDLWDYDVASQPVLANVTVKGAMVPALIQATKQGEIFLLDRRTGKPLAPVREVPVPQGKIPGERYSPTQPTSSAFASLVPPPMRESDMWGATPIDQMMCRIAFRKMNYQGRFTAPSLDESLIFPGNNGIMNWGSVAVDEASGIMVVPTSYMPLKLKLIPRAEAPQSNEIAIEGRGAVSPMSGTPYAVRTERPFLSPLGIPCNAPPWGKLTVIDLKTRQILWQKPLGSTADHAPLGIAVPGVFNQGGAMITKGGLVFIGATMDNYLRAFDIRTGKEVWKGRLPAGGQAMPMSYISPRTGKQYVVIAAGGHAFMNTTIGDYVVAFSLDRSAAPATK